MSPTRIPAPGFGDPVAEAQRTFRAVLQALARPTLPVTLDVGLLGPVVLTSSAAALVLALLDDSSAVWLDGTLRKDEDLVEWISFHTGAKLVEDPAGSEFAIVADSRSIPRLTTFGLGTDEAPHTSTTVIAVTGNPGPATVVLAEGPGFPRPARWDSPLAPGFIDEWAGNRLSFPRGVDLVLAGEKSIVGLPRTTRLRRPADSSRSGI